MLVYPGNEGTAWVHPELREGEVYLGNYSVDQELIYSTKRMGQEPLNVRGKPLVYRGSESFFPVFVSRSEYDEKKSQLGL